MARKTQASMIPQTAMMEITRNRVTETLDGWIFRMVRSTGGVFPPEGNQAMDRIMDRKGEEKERKLRTIIIIIMIVIVICHRHHQSHERGMKIEVREVIRDFIVFLEITEALLMNKLT